MSNLTPEGIDAYIRAILTDGIDGQNPEYGIFEEQNVLREDGHHEFAGLLGVWRDIHNPQDRMAITKMINMKGQPTSKQSDYFASAGASKSLDIRIGQALDNTVAATVEDPSHKNLYRSLLNLVVKRLMGSDAYGTYDDVNDALPEAVRMLFSKKKVLHTDAHIKVAFDRSALNNANVEQNEWDESLHFFVRRAHYDDKGKKRKVSLVAREGAKKFIRGDEFTEAELYDLKKNHTPGTNKYNVGWNLIYKAILDEEGGSIWVSRINDPEDPTKIRLVIMGGNREEKGRQRIIGDVFALDEDGRSIPVTFTQEESIKMMQSRQAWQWANSQDDVKFINSFGLSGFWDGWDIWTDMLRWFESDKEPMWTEAGGDFGREKIAYWHKYYSKESSEGEAEYKRLPANATGGRYLTEWSDPGKVEMDMFIDPLWKEIQTYEKSKTTDPDNPYKVNRDELYTLFQTVKNKLNGKPDFFPDLLSNLFPTGNTRTYFDSFFIFEDPIDFSRPMGSAGHRASGQSIKSFTEDPSAESLMRLYANPSLTGL